MKFFIILALFILGFSSKVSSKEVRCSLQNKHGQYIFDQIVPMEEGSSYNITLLETDHISIYALAMSKLVSIQAIVRDVQTESFGHLGIGVIVSDNIAETFYYALCEIKLDEKSMIRNL